MVFKKHMIWGTVAVCLALACSTSKSTSGTEVKPAEEAETIVEIALDQLGQLYTVNQKNEVIQYRADGTEGFRYNNNTLGRLKLVDPTNPFAILLYYPDFQTIVLLDRTLNEQSRIVLSELDLIDIELVAMGNDNYIWLYDAVDIQLKKLSETGTMSFQSDRLNQLLQQIPQPTQLLALNNQLLLNDPESGILVFDQYGRYDTTLPVLDAESLQLLDENRLVYLRAGAVYAYDLRALQEIPLELKISCKKNCRLKIGKEKAYWLENGQLYQRSLSKAP